MSPPPYPVFSIFAFLAFVLSLIPLPWHFQAWNSGTCLFMIWTAIGCLNAFVNSIVWRNNILDSSPIWCDISTRLMVGVSVGIPAASLCINRRLYNIASCTNASLSYTEKRRAVIVDLLIGLGIPALQMILQFVVQGHRYDIWEEIGCYPTTVNTPPAYPLSFLWPVVIGLISAVYCILTLRAFMQRRADFSQYLASRTSLTINRYFRLMCLATTELLFNLPITSYGIYLNITGRPIYPWTSWSDTHFDFFIVDKFSSSVWRAVPALQVNLELSRWLLVFCAFTFFGFFGFAVEARKRYTHVYWAIAGCLGFKQPQAKLPTVVRYQAGFKKVGLSSTFSSDGSVPAFLPRPLKLASSCDLNSVHDSDSTFVPSPDRKSFTKSSYAESIDELSLYPSPSKPETKEKFNDVPPLTPSSPAPSSYMTTASSFCSLTVASIPLSDIVHPRPKLHSSSPV